MPGWTCAGISERATAVDAVLVRLLRSRALALVCLVAPGLWPAWPLWVTGDPSVAADPAKYVLHHLGFTGACVLVAVLVLSPLRALLPHWRPVLVLQRHRRWIGVGAFIYAVLHVAMHFVYEGGFATFSTDWRKPFLFVGLLALVILLALAATSFDCAVRALGARRWKWLHRLVYVAAVLVLYHQVSARKVFPIQVVWLFGPLIALECVRIARAVAGRKRP